MPIVFARVDDRLIHGQVVQAWLPELNIDEVVIPCPTRHSHPEVPRTWLHAQPLPMHNA